MAARRIWRSFCSAAARLVCSPLDFPTAAAFVGLGESFAQACDDLLEAAGSAPSS